jgi:GxxExxY protein
LEKVYENALAFELEALGFEVQTQLPIKVYYNNREVGEYFADVIVENKVIIEVKIAAAIYKAHESQLLNYLKATEIEVGTILNFGQNAEYRRKFLQTKRKI